MAEGGFDAELTPLIDGDADNDQETTSFINQGFEENNAQETTSFINQGLLDGGFDLGTGQAVSENLVTDVYDGPFIVNADDSLEFK